MTLAQLNEHLDLVQKLQKTEELIQGLWDAAVPGAQKLDALWCCLPANTVIHSTALKTAGYIR